MGEFLDIREKQHEFTKEELYDLYVVKGMSCTKIAIKYKMKDRTVRAYIDRFKIKKMEKTDNKVKIVKQEKQVSTKTVKQEKQVSTKIVKKLKFKISKEELYKLYVEDEIRAEDIAKTYGISIGTVHRRIREYGIWRDHKKSLETYSFDDLKKTS